MVQNFYRRLSKISLILWGRAPVDYTLPSQSNGVVERVNSTIQAFLRNLQSGDTSWDQSLLRAVIAYNGSLHSELQMSPSKFLLSHSHSIQSASLVNTEKVQERWKLGHHKYQSFKVGQCVIKKVPITNHVTANKLAPKFKGSFIITKVNPNCVTYVITDPCSNQTFRAHHTDLMPLNSLHATFSATRGFERLTRGILKQEKPK